MKVHLQPSKGAIADHARAKGPNCARAWRLHACCQGTEFTRQSKYQAEFCKKAEGAEGKAKPVTANMVSKPAVAAAGSGKLAMPGSVLRHS